MPEGFTIRFGRVVNVFDSHDGGRIQVRTTYDNVKEKDDELSFCAPLLPKLLHVLPKVDELVLVFSMSPGQAEGPNYYIGPIIPQEDSMFKTDATKALAQTETGYISWAANPRDKKDVKPTLYPATEDITIEGRKDTGIQLKEEEVRIKAGVKVVGPNGPENNTKNPSFISLKYYPENEDIKEGYKSTATIVADKINLISTLSKDPQTKEIPVTGVNDDDEGDKDNLISDSKMRELVEKAHQVPYGDVLVDFLELFLMAFKTHIHPFSTMPPVQDANMLALNNYGSGAVEDKFQDMLSDNVRIN